MLAAPLHSWTFARRVPTSARVLVLALVSLASCSAFVSLDGLDDGDGGNPSGTGDASSDVVAPGLDAGSDAAVVDAASDAAVEACAGFCDGFDDRTSLKGPWSSLGFIDAGTTSSGAITSAFFLSPPNSAEFQIGAKSDYQFGGNYLTADLSVKGSKFSVDLDVKFIGNLAGYSGAQVQITNFFVNGEFIGYVAEGDETATAQYGLQYADGGQSYITPTIANPVDENWHHVHYEMVLDPTAGSIHVTWDGTEAINITGAPTFQGAPTSLTVNLGNVGNGPAPAQTMYYDNVQIQ